MARFANSLEMPQKQHPLFLGDGQMRRYLFQSIAFPSLPSC